METTRLTNGCGPGGSLRAVAGRRMSPHGFARPRPMSTFQDLATINPFRHKETEALDLVFQHYAYTTEAQLRLKELYYGYSGAVDQWKTLQAHRSCPLRLGEHFSSGERSCGGVTAWLHKALLPLLPEELLVNPAVRVESNTVQQPRKVLFVRPDAIGDAVLAGAMLNPIRQKYIGAQNRK